jgi:hypothetical protein
MSAERGVYSDCIQISAGEAAFSQTDPKIGKDTCHSADCAVFFCNQTRAGSGEKSEKSSGELRTVSEDR